ncbi:family 43 glycosylhydrolase [Microvirga sp. SYSU G3D207]|uniref:Family 43 glycosylhydrolase n=1 Tax=Microvirga arsenatis TaxID=2692265 RepID=A0ABW9Z711_9HYPH|nr:family 43 glycosylhydrolase [Microvirga arsenatis]NBJ26419.1 family 43 glycosylhydrolase [Microvirga arsenatis]
MTGERGGHLRNGTLLEPPDGAPFPFQVRLGSGGSPLAFAIAGPDPATAALTARDYELSGREQNDYLALFEAIARDFGTRLPRNRHEAETPSFTAPYRVLLDRNVAPEIWYGYGDPAVTLVPGERTGHGDWYYLFATSNDAPNSFPILKSRTLDSWELAGFVFPEGSKPSWAADGLNVSDYWAPEMHMTPEEFLVYFTAREKKDGSLAIGLARSRSPEGPFESDDTPLVRGGVIDPHLLVDRNGRTFLFWKEDSNDVWPALLSAFLYARPDRVDALFASPEDRRTASLALTLWPWVMTLEPMERFLVQQVLIEAVVADFAGFRQRLQALLDGSSGEDGQTVRHILSALRTPVYAQEFDPRTRRLLGERRIVLENDQAWEAHLIEGIWVLEHAGRFYMFYSGNDFSTPEYGTGAAVADSPLGPYRKMRQPLLRSSAEWLGPGHPSVAPGPDGEPWLFLHAFFPGEAGYKKFRALLAVPLAFGTQGVSVRTGPGG